MKPTAKRWLRGAIMTWIGWFVLGGASGDLSHAVAAAPKSPHAGKGARSSQTIGFDVNPVVSSRGSATWLGKAWFTREKSPEEIEDEEDEEEEEARQEALREKAPSKSVATVSPQGKESSPFTLSYSLANSFVYETKPAKRADSRPAWRWAGELSVELECEVSDTVTITPSVGTTSIRYFSQRALDTEEPYASLIIAWKFTEDWTASIRQESFWDLTPGYGSRDFAGHASILRLQYDRPNPGSKSPWRWQVFSEAVRSLAQPSEHDFNGFALGFGNTLRLISQKLFLQTQAGVSYADYPRFRIGGNVRRGWNTHAAASLVWRPAKPVEVSLGIEFMHNAETGQQFDFNDLSVPLCVKISF